MIIPVWLVASSWWLGVAHAEAPAPVAGTVTRIEVVGLRRLDAAAILEAIPMREGDRLDENRVRRSVEAIWDTGFVDDVVARQMPDPSGTGTIIIFQVKEKPAVREVRITGAKKIKEDDIREVIDIEAFTVPSEARIAANVRAIRDKYLEKGYFLVEVEPQIEEVGGDLVQLTFAITENRKVVVQRIDISGNDELPDRKIRRYLQTRQGGLFPWLTNSGTFQEANLENDTYIVRSVYLEEGYVEAQVDPPKVYLSPDKRHIFIDIHVTEGPRYRIGNVEVAGDFIAAEGLTTGAVEALIAGEDRKAVQAAYERDLAAGVQFDESWSPLIRVRPFDFNAGAPPVERGIWFKLSDIQATMQQVSDLYGDQGYAFANVVPLTETHPETGIVDVTFDVQAGDKMSIGRIHVTGNNPTYDKVVRREIPINEGEIYRGSAIREARARLERLGFFETVNISTPKGEGPNVLDMNVDVTERPTGSFSVGAGYGSADSYMLSANVQKNNFLGLGYLMSFSVLWSPNTQNGNLSFFDPHFLDSQWTFRIDGFYTQRQYIEDEYQRGGKLEIGRYLDQRNDIRIAMDYTIEDVGLLSLDEYKERVYGGELYRNGLTSSMGLSFEIDKRNNRINGTRGFRASVSTELAGGFRLDEDTTLSLFGGDFNFWQSYFNFRMYRPVLLKDDKLVFRYNLSFGHIQSTDGTIVPYIHRFRAGGILSIRGYQPYALGPSIRAVGYRNYSYSNSTFVGTDDPSNADDRLIIGGTETLINNFELESPIVKAAGISTVLFFDAGNAFGDPWGQGGVSLDEIRTAYGFGIRWLSPIGPLRFELGFPINPYPDERKAVLDFTIGSAF